MKKLIFVLILPIILCSCSVQETVNPRILIERIVKNDENVKFENQFYEDDTYVSFAKYSGIDVVFKFETDENENVKKINLACLNTGKVNGFINLIYTVINAYTPEDDTAQIINELFSERKLNGEFLYYETQWHSYSAVLSEKGLYFSVSCKKLIPESEVEFSLKPNDIVEY